MPTGRRSAGISTASNQKMGLRYMCVILHVILENKMMPLISKKNLIDLLSRQTFQDWAIGLCIKELLV